MVKKVCKVCKREYEAYDKPSKGRGIRRVMKRPYNSVTCSKRCSRLNCFYHECSEKYIKKKVALVGGIRNG